MRAYALQSFTRWAARSRSSSACGLTCTNKPCGTRAATVSPLISDVSRCARAAYTRGRSLAFSSACAFQVMTLIIPSDSM